MFHTPSNFSSYLYSEGEKYIRAISCIPFFPIETDLPLVTLYTRAVVCVRLLVSFSEKDKTSEEMIQDMDIKVRPG